MTEPETQPTTTDAQQNQFGYRTLESTHNKVRGEIIDGGYSGLWCVFTPPLTVHHADNQLVRSKSHCVGPSVERGHRIQIKTSFLRHISSPIQQATC